jgi:hypothetical protein
MEQHGQKLCLYSVFGKYEKVLEQRYMVRNQTAGETRLGMGLVLNGGVIHINHVFQPRKLKSKR